MRALVLLGAMLMSSCGGPPVECATTSSCRLNEACIDLTCVEVDCRSNAECPIENVCNHETFACEPGCTSSDDCFVGDRCDVVEGVCVPRTCTNTQLDCEFGERCNRDTGRCKKDPDPHCDRCGSPFACGTEGICAISSIDGLSYCFLQCSPESFDPCPAGMQCTGTTEGGFFCVGVCGNL